MRSMIPFPLPPALRRLFDALEQYTEEHEKGFFMAEQYKNHQHQAQPVLVYIRPESLRSGEEGPERRPPDWMGEVVGADDPVGRLPACAKAGVPEYWRVEAEAGRILVHTEPDSAAERYGVVEAYESSEPVRSRTWPGLELRPGDLTQADG